MKFTQPFHNLCVKVTGVTEGIKIILICEKSIYGNINSIDAIHRGYRKI